MAIGITEIATTISELSNDVGTLCKSGNINQWSKWKPIRSNKVVGLTSTDLENANFGLSIPTFSSLSALKTAYEAGTADYSYNQPRGGVYSEYFRIGDFRNYEHSASPVTLGYSISTKVYLNSTDALKKINGAMFLNSGGTNEIAFSDLNLDTYQYIGIAVYNSSGALAKTYINPTAGATNISLDVTVAPALTVGTYTAFMFISASATATTDIIGIHGVDTDLVEVSVENVSVTATITPYWVEETGTYRTVRCDIHVSNNSGISITLGSPVVFLRFSDKLYTDAQVTGEVKRTLIDITLLGGTSTDIVVDFTSVEFGLPYVVWWDNTGTYAQRSKNSILMVQPD